MAHKKYHKKFTTPFMVKDGKISFWHDDDNGSCFGSYPEPTRWVKGIDLKELSDALGITREDNLNYALRRLPGRDDIERLKAFCDKHKIKYEYSVEYDW